MRRASVQSEARNYIAKLAPDIALLQEVNGIPDRIKSKYNQAAAQPRTKLGDFQKFTNFVLSRFPLEAGLELTSTIDWVRNELGIFGGNILTQTAIIGGCKISLINLYSPAWPVAKDRLIGLDISEVKLPSNPDVWCTELLWKSLCDTPGALELPVIVGGDFNSSETFDYLWPGGPRGNREIIDRMNGLGFTEALKGKAGALVPTFRNPKGGKIIHQLDHLYMTSELWRGCSKCWTGEVEDIFSKNLSDHLPIIAEIEGRI